MILEISISYHFDFWVNVERLMNNTPESEHIVSPGNNSKCKLFSVLSQILIYLKFVKSFLFWFDPRSSQIYYFTDICLSWTCFSSFRASLYDFSERWGFDSICMLWISASYFICSYALCKLSSCINVSVH